MTNSHKNIINVINPFWESSTLLIMTFPEIGESKDLLRGRTCAVDNVCARRKGVLGKLYEIQISPERALRNSLKFPSYFGMEYVQPWNMGKKLLDCLFFRLFLGFCFICHLLFQAHRNMCIRHPPVVDVGYSHRAVGYEPNILTSEQHIRHPPLVDVGYVFIC